MFCSYAVSAYEYMYDLYNTQVNCRIIPAKHLSCFNIDIPSIHYILHNRLIFIVGILYSLTTGPLLKQLLLQYKGVLLVWEYMMTSPNGNIFRVTGHLCGEFTGPR